MDVNVVSRSSPRAQCAICHDEIGAVEATPCAECGTVVHVSCYATIGRCPTLGCRLGKQRGEPAPLRLAVHWDAPVQLTTHGAPPDTTRGPPELASWRWVIAIPMCTALLLLFTPVASWRAGSLAAIAHVLLAPMVSAGKTAGWPAAIGVVLAQVIAGVWFTMSLGALGAGDSAFAGLILLEPILVAALVRAVAGGVHPRS
jgi:hypothetical protein